MLAETRKLRVANLGKHVTVEIAESND